MPARAANEASLVIRAGSPLETTSWAAQTGPDAALGQQLGHEPANDRLQFGLELGELGRERADPARQTLEDTDQHGCFRLARACPQSREGSDELVAGECGQALTQRRRRRHERRLQLVERCRARRHGASPLEQQQAQILAPAATTRPPQTRTGDEATGGQESVDQIALAVPALASRRPLALVDGRARRLQEAHQPGAVAACALNGEGGHTELLRPLPKREVARRARLDLPRVELRAERVAGDSDVPVLVGVDTDCHRPTHHLASFAVTGSTGLGQGCVGQRTQASMRSPASRREHGGRQVPDKATSASSAVGHPAAAPYSQAPIG